MYNENFFYWVALMACNDDSDKTEEVEETEDVESEVLDSDGDGVEDAEDAFPDDSNESIDTDEMV